MAQCTANPLAGPMVEGWASYIATQLVYKVFTIYPDHPVGGEFCR